MKFEGRKFSIIIAAFCCCLGCDSENNQDLKTEKIAAGAFVDVTQKSGVQFLHDPNRDEYFMPASMASGGAFLDFDNDGDLDILLIATSLEANGGKEQMTRLYRQDVPWTFSDVTSTSGLEETGYSIGVAAGDINNDGFADIYISNYGADFLYQNNGDGSFSNISKSAGITNEAWSASCLFFDANYDGFLDIYVTNYLAYNPKVICSDQAGRRDYCGPGSFPGVADKLYLNNGDLTFRDASQTSGIARVTSKGLGVVSADFNDDGFPDIYVANDGEPNNLWMNQGKGKFVDEAVTRGAAINSLGRAEASMGIAVGFLSENKTPDLFITHLRGESNTLYRAASNNSYFDETRKARLHGLSLQYTGFGTGFFDYDHDGDLDLAVVNGRVVRGPLIEATPSNSFWPPYAEPNMLLENNGNNQFLEIGNMAGGFSKPVETSRGLAFGDVDNDGDIDLLVTNAGAPARLYRNDAPKKGGWLTVRAIDPPLNRDAIGAVITVFIENGKTLRRLVQPGYSYLSSNDVRAHFGLGQTQKIERVCVQWPGGEEECFSGIDINQFVTLRKGDGKSE